MGVVTHDGDLSFASVGKITDLVNGTLAQDAVTKSQLDAISGGVADGSITTVKLADSAVTAAKLAIVGGGNNLISNGDFESADFAGTWQLGYSGSSAAIAKSTTVFKNGTASGKVTGTASMETVGLFSVTPGETYPLSLWMYHDLAGATPGTHYVRVKRYDAAGIALASPNDVYRFRDNESNSTISAWTRFEYNYTVPADTYQLRFDVYNWNNSTGALYIDDVSFGGSNGVMLVQDEILTAGKITAAQIAANAITTSELATNAVQTINILNGAVTADKLESTVLAGPWTYPAPLNNWVNYSTSFESLRYRKEGSTVRLEGMIKSGTLNTHVFYLPGGFRPAKNHLYPMVTIGAIGRLEVQSGGGVYISGAYGVTNGWVSVEATFSIA